MPGVWACVKIVLLVFVPCGDVWTVGELSWRKGVMVYDILRYPDPRLKKTSEAVPPDDRQLAGLVDGLFETMYEYNGVGLAAPQVGVLKRVVVVDTRRGGDEKIALVNPEIVACEGEELGEEGCLSLPELYAPVRRAACIRVVARDLQGRPVEIEAEGFFARVIQHEVDHLGGRLFIDHLDLITRQTLLNEWMRRMAGEGEGTAGVVRRDWRRDSGRRCI